MAQQLAALDYGNQDISQWEGGGQNQSPELNGFWIDSSLKISPLEQVQVLTKVFEGRSQYTQEEVDTLRTIMLVQDDGTRQVYGKTVPALERPAGSWASRRRPGTEPTSRSTWPTRTAPSPAARPGSGLCPAKETASLA